jgi:hypothetical protein
LATSFNALQIKVELVGSKSLIWRRVLIGANSTLLDLHAVIQGAMGWEDRHIHWFEIGGKLYQLSDEFEELPMSSCEERGVPLRQVLKRKQEILYGYDGGDRWYHRVLLERRVNIRREDRLPICTAGKRACPPEDCGGIHGFEEFLAAVEDSEHPEHKAMFEWGEGFQAEVFSITQASNLVRLISHFYKHNYSSG